MPIPYRRCFFMDERGQQCETWFPAEDTNKLCPPHREIIGTNARNGSGEEQKIKYIDLVNDEREYCYHFLDGTAQKQAKTLIHEFKDDVEGSVFEKLDAHIGFLEKVLEDMKARLHSARAVRGEKLDNLSEDERKRLRSIKIDKEVRSERVKETTLEKATKNFGEKISFAEKQGINKQALLDMDEDALLAKFAEMKRLKDANKEAE